MDQRHQRELIQAFGLLRGDLRDWPEECLRCRSVDLVHDNMNRAAHCSFCESMWSFDALDADRRRRARYDVEQGVGGPLLALGEDGAR